MGGAGQYKLNKLSKALHADKAEANTPARIGNLLNNLHFSKNSYKEYLSTRKLVSEMELTEMELGGLCIIPTLSIKQEILKGASQNMLESYTADADEDLFKMIYASLNAARLVSTDDKEALSPNAGQAATQAAAARIVEKISSHLTDAVFCLVQDTSFLAGRPTDEVADSILKVSYKAAAGMAKELGYSFDTTRLIDNFLETLNSTYATTSFSSYPPSSVYD